MWRYSCWPCWRWKTQESQNKLGKTQSRGQRSVKQRKERGTDKWSWDKLWVFLTRPKPDFQSFLFLSSATLTSRPRHRVMRLWTTPRRIPAGVGGEDLAGHEATPYVPPSPSPHVESLWQLSSTPVLTFSPGGRQFFLLASHRHVGSDCEVCHISELRWSGSRYTKVDPALCYCQQRSSSLFLAIKPGKTICTVAPLSIYGIRSM